MAKKKDETTPEEPVETTTEVAAELEPEPELDQWARNLEVRPNPPGTI